MKKTIPYPDEIGRIPFTLRIGITGHRKLEDPASLIPVINGALSQLRELVAGSQNVVLVAVSALAEGADRLVTELILAEPDSRLEAALPLPVADYAEDFEEVGSKMQFEHLLKRASGRWTVPSAANREEAYERAGHYVVDRSDAIVALWDGEPARGRGGTGAIVAYAREREVPLVWVKTHGYPSVVSELGTAKGRLIQEAALQLQKYNTSVISAKVFESQAKMQRRRLKPDVPTDTESDPLYLFAQNLAESLIPYLVRADVLALRLQRQFRILSTSMFVMAAAAVTIVAIQASFLPKLNWIAAFELILLLSLLAIPLLNRRWRFHDRWITYRFLTERLRSVYFLGLVRTGDRRNRSPRLSYLSDSSEAWIERALAEVIARRPKARTGPVNVASLRSYLSNQWIGDQISYHEKTARLARKRDDRLLRATAILFGITLVAASLHMLGVGEIGADRSFWAVLLIVLSICVPAIGAAVHGIGTQRQFRRHAERYSRMARLLTQLQEDVEKAASHEELRKLAVETERIMREENSDWFGVMRFHDMELIT